MKTTAVYTSKRGFGKELIPWTNGDGLLSFWLVG